MAKPTTPAAAAPGQAKKQTSPEMASLAGRIMASPDPFEFPGMRESLHQALTSCDLQIQAGKIVPSDEIADQIIDAIRPCFEEWITSTRSLAASCLSQDERA